MHHHPHAHDHYDPHHPPHHMMGRRHRGPHGHHGFGGPEDEDGPGGFGRDFRMRRMLRGDDLRLVVLLLIADTPRHGYDLIKAIEEKSGDAYSPSPGVIYPALTYLEEAGYTSAESEGAKKVYAITKAGEDHLADNRAEAEAALETLVLVGKRAAVMREHLAERQQARDRDIPGVLPEVNDARRALKSAISAAARGDEATQKRLAEILAATAEEIGKLDIDI